MAVQLNERSGGKVLEVAVSDKLTHGDYEHFMPVFDRLVKQHHKIRVLFEMTDFHGWNAAALWDDIKFDLKHFSDIERLAMVGDRRWEQWMAGFCRPFTTATPAPPVQYTLAARAAHGDGRRRIRRHAQRREARRPLRVLA